MPAPGIGRGATRYQIAALLAAIGIVVMFIAVRFQTQPIVKSSPLEQRAAKYMRVWIDNADRPVGANVAGGRLTLERWDGAKWSADFGTENEPAWAVSPDFHRVAWISAGSLHSAGEDGTNFAVNLAPREAVAAGVLSSGSSVAVFRDGSVERFDRAGHPVGSFRTGLNQVDQAALESDYLAAASNPTRTILLFRFEGEQWKLVEQASAPDPPFQLILPAPGVVTELAAGALHIGGETRNTPGAARSAAAQLLDLLATGDFEGVWVLPPQRERYKLAGAQPGSILAASNTRMVVSGPAGTSLFALLPEMTLTATGRNLSSAAFALIGLALLVAFSGLLIEMVSRIFGDKQKMVKNIRIPLKLSDPPHDLVKNVAADECTLWAGAGLSAQAGYPTREAFGVMLAQTAAVENWAPSAVTQKVQSMCAHGKVEEGINELLQRAPDQRGKLIEFLRATYGRFGVPSRTHELIAQLKFPVALTTNYDFLLEQMRDAWINHTLTVGDQPSGREFVIKLYGNLRVPKTVLLSRAEFGVTAGTSPTGHFIAQMLETRTVLFLGCSAEGLLADLGKFNLGPKPVRTHYAVVGVSGSAWQAQAEQLSRRYGIELLVCDAEQMPKALPKFLERLKEEVGKVQRESGMAASAK